MLLQAAGRMAAFWSRQLVEVQTEAHLPGPAVLVLYHQADDPQGRAAQLARRDLSQDVAMH
jgi:hypothetical protein